MVWRSPVFPKTPLFGVSALPHRVQNCGREGRSPGPSRGRPRVSVLSHLDVFDSTADETAGLERVPVHVKDLWTRDVSPGSPPTPASRGPCSYPVGVSRRRGDHASSPPVPHGQRVLGVQTHGHQPLGDRQRRVWEEPETPAPGPRCVSPVLLHRRPDRPRRECGRPSGWTPSACRRCPRCR